MRAEFLRDCSVATRESTSTLRRTVWGCLSGYVGECQTHQLLAEAWHTDEADGKDGLFWALREATSRALQCTDSGPSCFAIPDLYRRDEEESLVQRICGFLQSKCWPAEVPQSCALLPLRQARWLGHGQQAAVKNAATKETSSGKSMSRQPTRNGPRNTTMP